MSASTNSCRYCGGELKPSTGLIAYGFDSDECLDSFNRAGRSGLTASEYRAQNGDGGGDMRHYSEMTTSEVREFEQDALARIKANVVFVSATTAMALPLLGVLLVNAIRGLS